jgi:hypothetical protein
MPSAPNCAQGRRRSAGLGVGANLQADAPRRPSHQGAEVAGKLGSIIFTTPARTSPVEPSMVMMS